jgi:hypothetical protein
MLTLTLTAEKETYSTGEPLLVKVVLSNTGPDPVVVNARMSLNAPFTPSAFREISFELTDPDGGPVVFEARINRGFPNVEDFQALDPGEQIERAYRLDTYHDLAGPGRYRARAVYQNERDPEDGRRAWKGELRSEEVALTVLG